MSFRWGFWQTDNERDLWLYRQRIEPSTRHSNNSPLPRSLTRQTYGSGNNFGGMSFWKAMSERINWQFMCQVPKTGDKGLICLVLFHFGCICGGAGRCSLRIRNHVRRQTIRSGQQYINKSLFGKTTILIFLRRFDDGNFLLVEPSSGSNQHSQTLIESPFHKTLQYTPLPLCQGKF